MTQPEQSIELTVIIPTLNEEACLPLLLGDILRQQGVIFEVLVSDGGSNDSTCQLAAAILAAADVPHQVLKGPPGRGGQMNRAVPVACGEWLLFLHADSRLGSEDAFRKGLGLLRQSCSSGALCRTAARFSIHFEIDGVADPGLGLFFCEAKARLGEPGCIHGDQGFLMSRRFFEEVGPYREDLPVMEDTFLAEAIRRKGHWLLLPVELQTSARRFRVEGFAERQTLNALLMNFLSIGWDDFLRSAPSIYRQQGQASGLLLLPFWREITRMLKALPVRRRLHIWYATGRYVCSQTWQLVFYREVRRHFLAGAPISTVDVGPVRRFKKWFDPLTCNPLASMLTALLTWCWFSVTYVRLKCKPSEASS